MPTAEKAAAMAKKEKVAKQEAAVQEWCTDTHGPEWREDACGAGAIAHLLSVHAE